MFGFFDWAVKVQIEEDAANRIYRLEEQIAEARVLLESIVCVKDPDKGVVLVDHESSTYWCQKRRAWVYKYEHFSPLGDALIELHEKLKDQKR